MGQFYLEILGGAQELQVLPGIFTSLPVPWSLGFLFINTPFVLLQLVMQYLYCGGAESLLIKNNEIMEVRNIYLHCSGSSAEWSVYHSPQGMWPLGKMWALLKSQQCLSWSAQAVPSLIWFCTQENSWDVPDFNHGRNPTGVTVQFHFKYGTVKFSE